MNGPIMALDVGTRRIGIAVSDEQGRMALPVKTVDARPKKEAVKRIGKLIHDYEVIELVVGWPLDMSGRESRAVDRVKDIVGKLEGSMKRGHIKEVPIHRWDERLTTSAADRLLIEADVSRAKRKGAIDQVAACKILEGYLPHRRTQQDRNS